MEEAANRATEPCAGSYGGSAVTAAHVSICYKKRWRMSDYLYLTLDSTDVADNVDRNCRSAHACRNGGRKGSRATADVYKSDIYPSLSTLLRALFEDGDTTSADSGSD